MRFMMVLPLALMAALFALGQPPGAEKPVKETPAFKVPDIKVDPTTHKVKMLPVQRTVHLGRKAAPKGKATLQFSKYMKTADVAPPATLDRATKAMKSIRQTYGNTQEGCCVESSGQHALGIVTANDSDAPAQIIGSDAESLAEYHRQGGPGDNGLVITQALEDWRLNGMLSGGKRRALTAWGSFNPANKVETQTVIIVFGGRLGFNVPDEWMNNANEGAVWDIPTRYNFVGGHDVRMIDYNEQGVRIATWGLIITVTWRALADSRIFDEAYWELLPDWYNADRVAGNGISADTLTADVVKIKNGTLPSWQPDVPSPPPNPGDCVLSDWSAWMPFDATHEIRTRTVITPQSGTGAACGPLIEMRDIVPPLPPEPPLPPLPPTPPQPPCVRQPLFYFGLFPNRPALFHRCR